MMQKNWKEIVLQQDYQQYYINDLYSKRTSLIPKITVCPHFTRKSPENSTCWG